MIGKGITCIMWFGGAVQIPRHVRSTRPNPTPIRNAFDLKLVLFLVLVLICGAHRNGVASYRDVTRAWRRCAVIGASCPCAPTKGPSG